MVGIYVYDRGGDRNKIFRYFIEHGLAFIVRMMKKRYLVHNGERTHILVLAVAYFAMVWIGKPERRAVLIAANIAKNAPQNRPRYMLGLGRGW